jgi:endonuclease/exonuclease/phosphatase family metal-dependent hydrolase
MEGEKHFPKIINLINDEQPDVICLQECPGHFIERLQKIGFYCTFAPVRNEIQNDVEYLEGNAIATKIQHTALSKYYYRPDREIPVYPIPTPNDLKHHNFILINFADSDGMEYSLATTHGIYTKNGLPTEHQTQGVHKMLSLLEKERFPLVCGDFNIPRHFNNLYEEFTRVYKDNIPAEYAFSLDKSLHIHGNNPNLTEPIFESYMVDYLFSRPEYSVYDVRLQFGVSDHAAIIATIEKVAV